jgi:predicted nucleic acid-binding protein
MKYWDSSALVSLLIEEQASEQRRALLRRDHGIVTWWGSWVECASALNRLHREGGIDSSGLSRSLEQLRHLAASWLEIRPLDRVRNRALRLLRLHPLRSADALQLAAALTAAAEDPLTLDIVCSDVRLSTAARQEGFLVL